MILLVIHAIMNKKWTVLQSRKCNSPVLLLWKKQLLSTPHPLHIKTISTEKGMDQNRYYDRMNGFSNKHS